MFKVGDKIRFLIDNTSMNAEVVTIGNFIFDVKMNGKDMRLVICQWLEGIDYEIIGKEARYGNI